MIVDKKKEEIESEFVLIEKESEDDDEEGMTNIVAKR